MGDRSGTVLILRDLGIGDILGGIDEEPGPGLGVGDCTGIADEAVLAPGQVGILPVIVGELLCPVIELGILGIAVFAVIGKNQGILLVILEGEDLLHLACGGIGHGDPGGIQGGIALPGLFDKVPAFNIGTEGAGAEAQGCGQAGCQALELAEKRHGVPPVKGSCRWWRR